MLLTGWLLWLCVGAWAITLASVLPVVMADLAIGESAVGWLGTFVGRPIVGAIIETTGSYVAVFATVVVLAVLGTGTILVLSEPAVR